MPGRRPPEAQATGAPTQAGPASGRPGSPSWIDLEPPLAARGSEIARRLVRRGAASWPIWFSAALAISAIASYRSARAPTRYQATVVVRVVEGRVEVSGSQLSGGALRSQIKHLAFTNARLAELMSLHPDRFRGLASDPGSVLEDFRKDVDVAISENDFTEDRAPDDPPRSARLAITFHDADPELAWTVASELAQLVIGSTLSEQTEALAREHAAAVAAVRRADAELEEIRRQDPSGGSRVAAAMGRRMAAQQVVSKLELERSALKEHQVLRFEIVDPGQVPARTAPLAAIVSTFFLVLLATLLAASLLVGAFDPRVLDVHDLAALGVTPLGQVPALPRLAQSPGPDR